MHVLRSVSAMMLTTANDAHKHAAAVLKNVEGWLDNRSHSNFLNFLGTIVINPLALLPPPPSPPSH
jgi:hypothetical protein